jgi:hypothetical protein
VSGLDRRHFLLGTGAVLLAACAGGDDDPDAVAGDAATTTSGGAPTPSTTTEATSVVLGTAFNRNTFLQAGIPQRSTFVLFEGSGGFVRPADAPEELTFEAQLAPDGARVQATVARHGDDLDRPYYPAAFTFPSPGVWAVTTTLPDGATLTREVQVNASVPFPQVGDALPAIATPTTAADLGVGTICTRTPACPFHEVSLADAMAAGRPVAALVSTPAYCQVAICGPVLDLLIAADAGDVAVVHIEAFPNGSGTDPGAPSPILTDDLGLDFEPVLFVAGADGVITARLDSIYDAAELASALSGAG